MISSVEKNNLEFKDRMLVGGEISNIGAGMTTDIYFFLKIDKKTNFY